MLFSVRLVIEQEILIFLIFFYDAKKKRFSDTDRKNGFHILTLHPKKYILKKYPFF